MVEGGLVGDRQADADVGVTATSSGSSSAATSGPSLSISTGGGSEVELGPEDLQFYLLLVQTTLLVYVTWKEATA